MAVVALRAAIWHDVDVIFRTDIINVSDVETKIRGTPESGRVKFTVVQSVPTLTRWASISISSNAV